MTNQTERKFAATPATGLYRRPETDADEAFLRDLYADTREGEMALVPWDQTTKSAFLRQQFDAQRVHYRREFPGAAFDVLLCDGSPIGRLYLDPTGPEWCLLDIALIPEHRNCGIGTSLLRTLLAEAAAAAKPVLLHVETFNPARRLYERLGFVPLRENGLYLLMIWRPSNKNPAPGEELPGRAIQFS